MREMGTLAVALMAGGKSTRMGCDKARLTGEDGRELWQERLALLRETGAEEVMISCREDQEYLQQSGVRPVEDFWPEAGPLGGIVSCLEVMKADRLLVLAVDLPAMTLEALQSLAAAARGEAGAVFRCGGFLEPLAGVYPKAMAAAGRRRLKRGDLALRGWIAEGEAAGLMQVLDAPEKWSGLFVNVNDAAEWDRWLGVPGT